MSGLFGGRTGSWLDEGNEKADGPLGVLPGVSGMENPGLGPEGGGVEKEEAS